MFPGLALGFKPMELDAKDHNLVVKVIYNPYSTLCNIRLNLIMLTLRLNSYVTLAV